MTIIKDLYFTVSEAAMKLGVSRQAVSKRIRAGQLNAETVGRTKLIPKREIKDWKYELLSYKIDKEMYNFISRELGVVKDIKKLPPYFPTAKEKKKLPQRMPLLDWRRGYLRFEITCQDGGKKEFRVQRREQGRQGNGQITIVIMSRGQIVPNNNT